jgi:hypothetical protein
MNSRSGSKKSKIALRLKSYGVMISPFDFDILLYICSSLQPFPCRVSRMFNKLYIPASDLILHACIYKENKLDRERSIKFCFRFVFFFERVIYNEWMV